jgi:hypothetical protein
MKEKFYPKAIINIDQIDIVDQPMPEQDRCCGSNYSNPFRKSA